MPKMQPIPVEVKPIVASQVSVTQVLLDEANTLYREQGIHPQWPYPRLKAGQKLTPQQTYEAIPYALTCESRGRDIKDIDSNGFYSYGIGQIQSSTWANFEALSGIKGSPMNNDDTIKMMTWAFENGYLYKWSCAKLTGII